MEHVQRHIIYSVLCLHQKNLSLFRSQKVHLLNLNLNSHLLQTKYLKGRFIRCKSRRWKVQKNFNLNTFLRKENANSIHLIYNPISSLLFLMLAFFMYLSKVFVKFVVDLIIQVTIRVFVDNQIYKINNLNIDVVHKA